VPVPRAPPGPAPGQPSWEIAHSPAKRQQVGCEEEGPPEGESVTRLFGTAVVGSLFAAGYVLVNGVNPWYQLFGRDGVTLHGSHWSWSPEGCLNQAF
jgi:hypothetical protein